MRPHLIVALAGSAAVGLLAALSLPNPVPTAQAQEVCEKAGYSRNRGCPASQQDNYGCCPPAPKAAPKPKPKPQAKSSVPMVKIPGGTYTIGSPGSEEGRLGGEGQVQVTLSSFRLMEREVTQGEFEAVMGWNPSQVEQRSSNGESCASYKGVSLVDPSYPVMCVTWKEAIEFANALSRRDGLTPAYSISGDQVTWKYSASGYRLPTDAEWEVAARGGASGRFGSTDSENALCSLGNIRDSSAVSSFGMTKGVSCSDRYAGLAPVKSYRPNGYGAYDMVGNVWEWTWDWYASERTGGTNPRGPSAGSMRVLRGGSWSSEARLARVAFRLMEGPGTRIPYLGFRLARN